MDHIVELQAEICRVLSHPARIAILHQLTDGPAEVGRLAGALGISQPNASQHLAVMRAVGLVEATRSGREVAYSLVDDGAIEACDRMAQLVRRRIARIAALSTSFEAGSRLTAGPKGRT